MTEEEMQVWLLVRESNRAWTAGATHELTRLFAPDAVLVKPDFGRVEGAEAIVRSYEEFVHHARTSSFEELEHAVSILGDLAMVTYRFQIRYTPLTETEERDESGQEVLALRRSGASWQVIWRTQTGG